MKLINRKNMKNTILIVLIAMLFFNCEKVKESKEAVYSALVKGPGPKYLFLDVHNLEPGKVTFEAVADAHQKDLAKQRKYRVSFIKYWVDEEAGKVYCLAESPDSASIYHTHNEAHGLVPDLVRQVSDGLEAMPRVDKDLFLDIHRLGAGNVTAAAVVDAHRKDLAVQGKYNVNFINYWVDEKSGMVVCLSDAKDAASIIETHKSAHGLLPDEVHKVKQGE